jgi:glutaredoxin
MTVETPERADTIEVYWRPGCSSCLLLKEFMENTGLEYEEINLIANPERNAKLDRLGVMSPAVAVGNTAIPGLDFEGISALIGIPYDAPVILPPAILKEKYEAIADVLVRTVSQIPEEELAYFFPDRPNRTMRGLVTHAGVIVRKFLESYETNVLDRDTTGPLDLCEHGTSEQLIEYCAGGREEFLTWWENYGHDDDFSQVVDTKWGMRSLHAVFERTVWHTAQHTRQFSYFLVDHCGVTPEVELSEDTLAGLPMPKRVLK